MGYDFGDTEYIIEFVNPKYKNEVKRGNVGVKQVRGRVENFCPNSYGVLLWDVKNNVMAIISLDWILAMYPIG